MRIQIYVGVLVLCLCGAAGASGVFDKLVVNGHPGFLSAYEVSGPADKILIIVKGYDSENSDHPIEDLHGDFQPIVDLLGPDGWDIIVFDYVDGSIDIKQNADNLAHFIKLVHRRAEPGYHLAVIGGSMGGIVARTMFVQEYHNMGVDTFVTVDSPHYGVWLSAWVEDLALLLIDTVAGHQMTNGQPEYGELYGWLMAVEHDGYFMPAYIDPMATCAIALSDGESDWNTSWGDLIIHTKFHDVASYVYAEGLTSDYMPYHSTIYMDDYSTHTSYYIGYNKYYYYDTTTSYFDQKIPNPQDEHGAPEYAVQQAVDFVVAHGPAP